MDQEKAVLRMQDYIAENLEGDLSIDDVCSVSGYSKRHALRLFKDMLHMALWEYIRDCRLARAAKKLMDEAHTERIFMIALDAGFESHEGFSKAFQQHFGVLPQAYRRRYFPDNYQAPAPMSYYYLQLRSKGVNAMSETRTVTATFFTKPACKLILKRGIRSTDYFSYCDEIGCAIWDDLEKISSRLDKVVFVTLPDFLVKEGTSKVATAVEAPLSFEGPIPSGCDLIQLPEQDMICFQGQPYEDEDWFGGAHSELDAAMKSYKPEIFGFTFATDKGVQFQYPASAIDGVRACKPIARLG